MTERETTTEGAAPHCRMGAKTDNPCPRPAAVNLWGDGEADLCAYHDRKWRLNDELGALEGASDWLDTFQQQASMLDIDPLTEGLRFAKAQAEAEIARLEREMDELESGESTAGAVPAGDSA